MGHRVNPIGLRLTKTMFWDSVWFSSENYSELLHEDLVLKSFITSFLNKRFMLVNKIILKRVSNKLYINLYIYKQIRASKKIKPRALVDELYKSDIYPKKTINCSINKQ